MSVSLTRGVNEEDDDDGGMRDEGHRLAVGGSEAHSGLITAVMSLVVLMVGSAWFPW